MAGVRPFRSRLVIAGALVAVVIALVVVWIEINYLMSPVNPGREVSFTIPQGASAREIASILHDNGLIRSPLLFRYITKRKNLDGQLKAGEYVLGAGLTLSEVIERLRQGQVNTVSFTVPEGLTVVQIADHLVSKGLVDRERFLAAARNRDLVKEFLPDDPRIKEPLEGYLYPSTYKIRKNSREEEIVRIMVDATKAMYTESLRQKLADLNLTFHQALTLASIIEREAVFDEERPLISAVYNNRLRIKMKLDADPTVLYALGRSSGPVTYKDLEVNSPYNTYKVPGLPPGPIANPGAKSLAAAVNPAPVDYLYFVATPDKTHVFSKTLSEHTMNVKRIQSSSSR